MTVQVVDQGSHHVLFFASDSQSVEATHDAGYVNVDSHPPILTGVRPVSAKRHARAQLRFLIDDGPESCGSADVTIRIAKGAKTVQTLTPGPRATNVPLTYAFRVNLATGRYTYVASARDAAGNASAATGAGSP